MDRVDATMNSINEQRELANEISEAISNPLNSGFDLDEVRASSSVSLSMFVLCVNGGCANALPDTQDALKAELEELEQDTLNERLMNADHVPVHAPAAGASRVETRHPTEEEAESEELKELQAALAM